MRMAALIGSAAARSSLPPMSGTFAFRSASSSHEGLVAVRLEPHGALDA